MDQKLKKNTPLVKIDGGLDYPDHPALAGSSPDYLRSSIYQRLTTPIINIGILKEEGEASNKEEDEDNPLYDDYFRLLVYFFFYGIVFEISVLLVRYTRHYQTHDEYHMVSMILVGLVGTGLDVWFTFDYYDEIKTELI